MLGHVLDWIYPPRCGLCGRLGRSAICGDCLGDFTPLPTNPDRVATGPIDLAVSVYRYEGRAAQAVRRLKYSRSTQLIDPLSLMLRTAYDAHELDAFEAIVPVPIHWRRRAYRGFNQAEALASRLPKEQLRADLLRRVRMTRPQVGLGREERMRNLVGAFRASADAAGRSVLLVDDVTTSGHTAQQCAIALREAGAKRIGLLTLTGER